MAGIVRKEGKGLTAIEWMNVRDESDAFHRVNAVASTELSILLEPPTKIVERAKLLTEMLTRRRPHWIDRKRSKPITPADFIKLHYQPEIKAEILTRKIILDSDPSLYLATIKWMIRNQLQTELGGVFSSSISSGSAHYSASKSALTEKEKFEIRDKNRKNARRGISKTDLTGEAISEIRDELSKLRFLLPNIDASNSLKADIDTDIGQISSEIERPTPRKKILKSFLEGLRDNLIKTAAAGVTGTVVAIGGLLAKHFGWF